MNTPSTPSLRTPFFALMFAVMLLIAGCSASTLSGPELAPAEEAPTEAQARPYTYDAGPNSNQNGGGSVGHDAPANETGED